jgi:hypothetical protein
MEDRIKLRPHHLIDIVRDVGHGMTFAPHPYGHAVHTVAQRVIDDPDLEVEFVLGADDICRPCRHLRADGKCADVLRQLAEPVSKQVYNDALDGRLFALLGIEPGVRMTARSFLTMLDEHMPGIVEVCAHPGEQRQYRHDGLRKGLARFLKSTA